MKFIVLLSVLLFTFSSFAKKKRKPAAVDLASYQTEACGSVNRVRYQRISPFGGKVKDTVKILIDSTNIMFDRDNVEYDPNVLSLALVNKEIKVCYYPQNKAGGNLYPILDFHYNPDEKE